MYWRAVCDNNIYAYCRKEGGRGREEREREREGGGGRVHEYTIDRLLYYNMHVRTSFSCNL